MTDQIKKTFFGSAQKADPAADIALINQHSVKKLSPEDVYCFAVNLCDNDVDRDNERFTDATLGELAKLFVGKPGITDHVWSSARQLARIYRAEVVDGNAKNALGEPLKQLRASAYMLKNEQTQPVIDAIDGGIMKEISVGCRVKKCNCHVCGEALSYDWRFGQYKCPNDHVKGESYDGVLCVGDLEDAEDAYEFSFVAVPAQKGAGVTKSAKGAEPFSGMSIEESAHRRKIYESLRGTVSDAEWKTILERAKSKPRPKDQDLNRDIDAIIREIDTDPEMRAKMEKSTYRVDMGSYSRPDEKAKAAFFSAAMKGKPHDMETVLKEYEGLGAIPALDPNLGKGSYLLPQNLSRELLTEPLEENSLRTIETVSSIRGLEEPKLLFRIDDARLEDVTDKETAREIEMEANLVTYGRHKVKIMCTVEDTVMHLSDYDLASTIEGALKSALATREKMSCFAPATGSGAYTTNTKHMSFYSETDGATDIKTVYGKTIIDAIIGAWADLPDAFAGKAVCCMRRQDYYAAIRELAGSINDLWGRKPEDIIGIPVVFNDRAVVPVIGDFKMARLNYDIAAIYDTDKDGQKGEYYFVLTAWFDHRIRLRNAFRLAKVEA